MTEPTTPEDRADPEDRAALQAQIAAQAEALERVNAELHAALEKLAAHDRARAEFIDNVSHELRTPLASMSYSTANLLRGIAGPVPDRIADYLSIFKQECGRLLSTVGRLLDLGRIDAGTLALHRMKIPLSRFVRFQCKTLRAQQEEEGPELHTLGEGVTGFVSADPLRLGHVIASIVRNGLRYSPPDGKVEVAVRTVRDGQWGEVTVTDEGEGVKPEDLPRLTDRYYRVGEFVDGTGLGLSYCKEILDLQGGELELLSPPPGCEHGTQVCVRLPLVPPPTVLAVDDSRTVRMLITRQLTSQGYEVKTCDCAEAGLEALKASPPEMLVVDSVMPGMNGVEMILEIKSIHELRPLPVIMLTGAELDRAKREILEGFSVPVLGKPWRKDELVACLEDAVYGKRHVEG